MEASVLKEKLQTLSNNIPSNQWKYFHRSSMKNFIINLELIKGKTERATTAEILINFLNDVEHNFVPDVDYSIYLFNNYLKYVVPTYQNRLGFWPIPNRKVLIFLTFVAGIIFFILLKYLLWKILFSSAILFFACILLIKFKNHKVFGFRY